MSSELNYIRDGADIYKNSFAIIRAEARLSRFTSSQEKVAVRMIHACGMVELAEDIFLKPVRKGLPLYSGALHDMVASPRSATVMGLLEEARLARSRGMKAAQQAGSVQTLFGRVRDWFVGNF